MKRRVLLQAAPALMFAPGRAAEEEFSDGTRQPILREDAPGLVVEFLLPHQYPRQVGMQGIDFAHRPVIERLREHDVDEVEDLHSAHFR